MDRSTGHNHRFPDNDAMVMQNLQAESLRLNAYPNAVYYHWLQAITMTTHDRSCPEDLQHRLHSCLSQSMVQSNGFQALDIKSDLFQIWTMPVFQTVLAVQMQIDYQKS